MFYVVPTGNDSNDGSFEHPFRTLAHARDVVRREISNGMTGPVEVVVRGGDYYLDDTLIFDDRDSGRDGFEVIYRAYPGEIPRVYCGQRISGWERFAGEIYRARVPQGMVFHTMTENGERCLKARSPNTGYFIAEPLAGAEGETRLQFQFAPGDVPQVDNPQEMRVYIWSAGPHSHWNWFTDIVVVESVDYTRRVVTLRSPVKYDLAAGGSRYYVQGALSLLDQPGEFYLDDVAGWLYYWPRHQPIEDQVIVAPRLTRALAFVGRSAEQIASHIRFEGFEVLGSDFIDELVCDESEIRTGQNQYEGEDGLIYLENADYITIDACHVHNAGLHGVYVYGRSQHNVIRNCWIHDIGYTGVLLADRWLSASYVSQGNVVLNNHIHDTGRLVGHGAGVQILQSGQNIVRNNRIHHTPRYSISFNSPRPGSLKRLDEIDGVPVNDANMPQFIHCRYNVIEFNDVSHANTDSQDTGPLQTWGVAYPGNVINNNRVHHSEIPLSFGFGIYVDDASDGVIITNNILHDLQWQGGGVLRAPIYVKGVGSQVINNIVADNNVADAPITSFQMAGEPNHDLVIERNVFYNSGNHLYDFTNWEDGRFARADYNLFYAEGGMGGIRVAKPETFTGEHIPASLAAWQQVLGGRYDQHSQVADPSFMDATRRDYRLRYDTPLSQFEPINEMAIGLTADYPFADPGEELERLFIWSDVAGHSATLRLQPGQLAHLGIGGRTISGYVAEFSGSTIRYASDSPQVAVVSPAGVVTAQNPGTARITAHLVTRSADLSISVIAIVEGS